MRETRERLGLTQDELARRLGVRQQTVSDWERGLHQPKGASVTLLRMVAEEAARYEARGYDEKKGPDRVG